MHTKKFIIEVPANYTLKSVYFDSMPEKKRPVNAEDIRKRIDTSSYEDGVYVTFDEPWLIRVTEMEEPLIRESNN